MVVYVDLARVHLHDDRKCCLAAGRAQDRCDLYCCYRRELALLACVAVDGVESGAY